MSSFSWLAACKVDVVAIFSLVFLNAFYQLVNAFYQLVHAFYQSRAGKGRLLLHVVRF